MFHLLFTLTVFYHKKKIIALFFKHNSYIGNRYRECMETAFVLSLPLPYCIGLRRYLYDCLANLK